MPAFARYLGIDYPGAQTPSASLKGLRVYMAEDDASPVEMPPPPSPRKYWTRRGIDEWLVERRAEDMATRVGIDRGFSFPLRYFEVHGLKPRWPPFLDDFQLHWPTYEDDTYVDFVRDGTVAMARRVRECPVAAADRRTRGKREIRLSFRRARAGRQIQPCRDSLAALHSRAAWAARSFLAVRRVGDFRRALRHR